MKNLSLLFIILLLMGCSTQKTVYWCGDHPCINKKEREAYFKKTMIVEIKDLKDKKFKKSGEIEKIINEAKTKEKVRIKNEKEHAKIKKIEEKSLTKQRKIEEKRLIKEEKILAKQIKIDEKKRIKEEKKLLKQIKKNKKRNIKLKKVKPNENHVVKAESVDKNIKVSQGKFAEIVESIIKRNNSREYPEINDIPK